MGTQLGACVTTKSRCVTSGQTPPLSGPSFSHLQEQTVVGGTLGGHRAGGILLPPPLLPLSWEESARYPKSPGPKKARDPAFGGCPMTERPDQVLPVIVPSAWPAALIDLRVLSGRTTTDRTPGEP